MEFFETNIKENIETEKLQRQSHTIWCEKHRPVTLDTFIGNELVKEKAAEYISKNDLPHLLFHGRAGGGKCLDFDEFIEIEIDVSEDEEDFFRKFEVK
jgi:Holliday junction resolvasome RuvABC ATP-dependent DNA helicase subunit